MLSQVNARSVTVKFLIEEEKGRAYLLGSAMQIRDFQSFWSFPVSESYEPLNLEKEYAIWKYLGLPVPDMSFVGVSSTNHKVVFRTDYPLAFQGVSSGFMEPEQCFDSSYGRISQYQCNADVVKEEHKNIIKKREQILLLVDQCESGLNTLGIVLFRDQFSKIRDFLR